MAGLKKALGDDIWPVEVPYHDPPANHIACAFNFAKGSDQNYEERTLTAPGFFENMTAPALVETFPWPDPTEHMDLESCRAAVDEVPEGYAKLGILWASHFQDACAAFGMENALMTMIISPSHEAILPDIPPTNIAALFAAIRQ
jgi:uroporphyrinogen decarboxylase